MTGASTRRASAANRTRPSAGAPGCDRVGNSGETKQRSAPRAASASRTSCAGVLRSIGRIDRRTSRPCAPSARHAAASRADPASSSDSRRRFATARSVSNSARLSAGSVR